MESSVNIFISYAHKDDSLRKELEKHLSQMKWQSLIAVWHDRNISAGTEWEREIDAHLNGAQIILLLVSPDFMASKYCYSVEMQRAMERHQSGDAYVIPIILRSVYWEGAPFSHLQALPTNALPVVSHKWHTRDDAFVDVVRSLHKIVEEILKEGTERDKSLAVPREQKHKHQQSKDSPFAQEGSSYVGKQIGKYSILKELGNGTYGRVYWGRSGFLTTRFVAIKLMHATHLSSQEKQKSFLREAQILRMLRHPHILPLLDVGLHKGLPYLVTEYAPHGSLRELLRHQSAHLLSLEESLTILSEIGQALHYAHQHDIIHRDLKPENVLFDANRKVLLADFGTATVLTTAGNKRIEIAGTPQYMAPEQFGGHASKKSDLYALGCIAYELLTGHTPFTAPDFVSMWFQHTYTTPKSPALLIPELPPYISKAVLRALEKEPGSRYTDVLTFIKALQEAKLGLQVIENTSASQEESESLLDFSFKTRRLPLYFLLDCSQSVVEDSLSAMSEGLRIIQQTLMDDPRALETVRISVIYFSNYVNQTRSVPLDQFVLPTLVVGGAKRVMGAAFRILVDSIRQDFDLSDYRPMAFLLASGLPTDHYQQELKKLESLPEKCQPTIVALWSGCY